MSSSALNDVKYLKEFNNAPSSTFADNQEIRQPLTWSNWKHELLCRLGLRYDTSRFTFKAPTPTTKPTPTPTKTKLPVDVHYDKAFQNLVRQQYDFDNNVFELSVYKVADKNTDKLVSDLTDLDRQLLQEKDLNELKAIRLKPLWAKGLSSQVVAEDISRTEKGYSWRELKKYWAVFNEVAKIDDDTDEPLPFKKKKR